MPASTTLGLCLLLVGTTLLSACDRAAPQPPARALDDPAAALALLAQGRWVDLTHDFASDTLYWPTAEGFSHEVDFAGTTDKGYYYSSYRIAGSEHGGTHLDAPVHFAEGRQDAAGVPLAQLIGPAAVIDVSAAAAANPDYQIGIEDLRAWERNHGELPAGAIVLFNTGWHKRWPDARRYLGTADRGAPAVALLHFPGIAPELARWLVAERSIAAVGIDTASIDYGQSTLFQTHRILFGRNLPAFENVASLSELPARGALVVALPMKIRGGSGGPLRIVAWLPEP